MTIKCTSRQLELHLQNSMYITVQGSHDNTAIPSPLHHTLYKEVFAMTSFFLIDAHHWTPSPHNVAGISPTDQHFTSRKLPITNTIQCCWFMKWIEGILQDKTLSHTHKEGSTEHAPEVHASDVSLLLQTSSITTDVWNPCRYPPIKIPADYIPTKPVTP